MTVVVPVLLSENNNKTHAELGLFSISSHQCSYIISHVAFSSPFSPLPLARPSISFFKSSLIRSSSSRTAVITFMTQILLLTANYFMSPDQPVSVRAFTQGSTHSPFHFSINPICLNWHITLAVHRLHVCSNQASINLEGLVQHEAYSRVSVKRLFVGGIGSHFCN